MPRAEIASKQALHTLNQLHAELAGKVLDNKAEAKRLHEAMLNIEAVIRLLDPGHDIRPVAVRRRKPNPWFKRGTMYRCALDVLRDARSPMTAREIVAQMLAIKGLSEPSKKALRDLIGSVQTSLANHDGRGVRSVGEGMPARWEIV